MWLHVESIINLTPIENESLLINGNPSHCFNMIFDVSNGDERRGDEMICVLPCKSSTNR